jgi:hypothetical protein
MAAASALQAAMEEFSEAPKIPTISFAGIADAPKSEQAANRRKLIADIDEFVAFVNEHLKKSELIRAKMTAVIAPIADNPALASEVSPTLDKFVEQADKQVSESKARNEHHAKIHRDGIRSIASALPAEARFIQTQVQKFSQAANTLHNDVVDFYYFLLSLRSVGDPEARDGPHFERASDLDAYIRAQLKA